MMAFTYYPKDLEGKQRLAERVAMVYGQAVADRLQSPDCPRAQRMELLHALLAAAKEGKIVDSF